MPKGASKENREHLPGSDTARKFPITGKDGQLPDLPTINGNNLFQGEFAGKDAEIGLTAFTQHEWEQAWDTLGNKPPGPLPKGSRGVFEAVKKAWGDATVSFEPERIEIKPNKEIEIDWKRVLVGKEHDKDAKPRYSVVLLPEKGKLKAKFNDIWPVIERIQKLQKFNEITSAFRKGRSKPITAPEKAAFRRNHQMGRSKR